MKKLGILATLVTLLTLNITLLSDLRANEADQEVWTDLKSELFDNRSISTEATWLKMEAPYRAHDAALVPITIKAQLPKDGQVAKQGKPYLKTLTIVIDNNPVPVAAKMNLSPKLGPLHMETRLRVNQYTHIRAIVETNKGELYMISKYVKAAGGCSAPAMKDIDAKMAALGKMKLRQFSPKAESEQKQSKPSNNTREIQLMVRHPNYSGMQMNQVTGYYIPAHFVSGMEIKLDDDPLIELEGAISLSEDPMLRFRFLSDKSAPNLEFVVKDTKNKTFKKQWQLKSLERVGS